MPLNADKQAEQLTELLCRDWIRDISEEGKEQVFKTLRAEYARGLTDGTARVESLEAVLMQAEGEACSAMNRADLLELSETPEYMNALQTRVGIWARQTFPRSTLATIADHACEEMLELVGIERMEAAVARFRQDIELGKQNGRPSAQPDREAAGVTLLLLHLSDCFGFYLINAILQEFERVQARTWKDDGRGYGRHTEEENPPG